VDDQGDVGGTITFGVGCSPDGNPLSDTDIMSHIDSAGAFTINVQDRPGEGSFPNNLMSVSGYARYTYTVTDPELPPITSTNVEEEVCERRRCSDCEETTNPGIGPITCNDCTIEARGSPQASVNAANFDISVEDIPIWHETAVGPSLALEMRFSNFASTNARTSFGPKWSCYWDSQVRVVNSGTNVMTFPSGSVTEFVRGPGGDYAPPGALSGVLITNLASMRYEKPDGWCWLYEQSEGDAGLYLLTRVWDAWSNTVAVSYTNDRVRRVTQVVPNSGRYIEFSYSGSGTRATNVSTEAAAPRSARFTYSANGYLTNVVDMGGFHYSYLYTNQYISKVIKGAASPVTRLDVSYDPAPSFWTATNSHAVRVQDVDGRVRYMSWDLGLVTDETSFQGATTRQYAALTDGGARGQIIASRGDSDGTQIQYSYGPGQRVTSRVDRTGATWALGYNTNHMVTTRMDPFGNTSASTYDDNGVDVLYTIPPSGVAEQYFTYVPGRHAVATESNAAGRVVFYFYNSLGLVTNRDDGRVTEVMTYDAEGRLLTRSRNEELHESNQYDAYGRLSVSSNAAGLVTTFTHDDLNRLTSQEFDNLGQISTLSNHYDCCFIDQVIDRNGNTTLYEYNDLGLRLWETNPKGLTTYYTYGLHREPTSISNALQWTTRSYDSEGRLSSIVYPQDRPYDQNYHAENFWYDGEGRLIKRQGVAGEFYFTDYDSAGRRTASYVPNGETPVWSHEEEYRVQSESNRYDSLGRVVWTRDIRGMAVSNAYNTLGQVVTRRYPDDTTEEWTYNLWSQVTSTKDRNGNITSNIYDNLGRLSEQIDPRGVSTHYSYTAADYVASVSNAALGYAWHHEYDAEGRVTQTTYPDGSVETRAYDPMGNPIESVHGGVTTVFEYDEMGNRTRTLVDGEQVDYGLHDGLGRRIYTVNAEELVTTNSWDSWGELNGRFWPQQGLQETLQYGDRGLTNQTDRLGISSRYVRDVLKQVASSIDGADRTNRFIYATDGIGQLWAAYDGNGNETAWGWTIYGTPEAKAYSDGSFDLFYYDSLNRLTNQQTGNTTFPFDGLTSIFKYDAAGNLVSDKRGSAAAVTFGLDAMNWRTNMVDALGTTVWTNDALGRIASESSPLGGPGVDARYDALGRLTNLTYAGYNWQYAYDSLGRVASIQAPEGAYTLEYYKRGLKKLELAYPNGVTAFFSYDALGRLSALEYQANLATLKRVNYGYDAGDRRTAEYWSGGRAIAYGYDEAHQLLSATSTSRPSDTAAFAYDLAGNPLRQTTLGLGRSNTFNVLNQLVTSTYTGGAMTVAGEVNYPSGTVTVNGVTARLFGLTFEATNVATTAGSNQITAVYSQPVFTNEGMVATSSIYVVVGSATNQYDRHGNLTNDAEFVYRYDNYHRLTNVVKKATGSSVLACSYDGLGRRRQVVRDGSTTERYVYVPGTWLVLAVLDATNGIKELYTHGPDLSGTLDGAGGIGGLLSVSHQPSSINHFLHSDALGNIVMATDTSGVEVASYQYSPYGQVLNQTGTFECRYLFSSKEYDPESGLYYYGHRYYIPTMATWLTRDPAQELGGANLYGFSHNTPLTHIDALGLLDVSVVFYSTGGGGPPRRVLSENDLYIVPLDGENRHHTWGEFRNPFSDEISIGDISLGERKHASGCKVYIKLTIALDPGLPTWQTLKNVYRAQGLLTTFKPTYVPHATASGGGQLPTPFAEVVEAHERGHAKAYLEVYSERELEVAIEATLPGDIPIGSLEGAVERACYSAFAAKRITYDQRSAHLADQATLGFYDNHPEFERDTSYGVGGAYRWHYVGD